jgi:hypothetical protein
MLLLNIFKRKKPKESLILDEFFISQPKKMKNQSTLINKSIVEKKQSSNESSYDDKKDFKRLKL